MDLYELVQRDVFDVFERWADRSAEYFDRSRDEFEGTVMPRAYYAPMPSRQDVQFANVCYTEWFLFEFGLREGKTPLECYVEHPLPTVAPCRVERLRQVAETQRFAQFAIRGRRMRAGELVLVDVEHGREYCVCAPTAARRRRWKDGAVSMRVAHVDGVWLEVGKTVLYDRNPGAAVVSRDRGADASARGGEPGRASGLGLRTCAAGRGGGDTGVAAPYAGASGRPSFFLNLLADVIGLGGAYTDTVRMARP